MCGICGVIGAHHEDVLDTGLLLTNTLWNRGHDGVGIAVANHRSGTIRRNVNVREKGSKTSPMDNEFRRSVTGNARDIGATMLAGQTKFTTVALSDDKGFVLNNTQPLCCSYPRDGPEVIPESLGICNGEVMINSITGGITTPSLSEAVVDTRYMMEAFHDKRREFGDDPWQAAEWFLDTATGGFIFGFSEGRDFVLINDKGGIRPGVVGRKKGKHGDVCIVCSEDGYFSQFGIERGLENFADGNILGGEVILFRPGEEPIRRRLREELQTPCWFEGHYVQRYYSLTPDGSMSNSSFREHEITAVADLYRDEISDYDFGFAVPNSGKSFGAIFTELVGLHYKPDVCRKPVLHGESDVRNYLIARLDKAHKFEFIETEIKGKDGVGVDDSIVAGDSAVQLYIDWKRRGGGRLALVSAAPPMFRRCPYGIGFPEDGDLVAHGMLDAGLAKEIDGEITYRIKDANDYVTKKLQEKIRARVDEFGLSIDASDFRVLYTPRDIIQSCSRYISDSGMSCQYCLGGKRVDYNQGFPLVQRVGAPPIARISG